MQRNLLRSLIDSESRAYGFTIAFWGSGTLLISSFGVPGIERILFYATGAIAGFGITTLIAYKRFFDSPSYEQPQYLVFSTIHYLAALGPIIATYAYVSIGSSILSPGATFFLSGASVSFTYNILMLVEEKISEEVRAVEEKFIG